MPKTSLVPVPVTLDDVTEAVVETLNEKVQHLRASVIQQSRIMIKAIAKMDARAAGIPEEHLGLYRAGDNQPLMAFDDRFWEITPDGKLMERKETNDA